MKTVLKHDENAMKTVLKSQWKQLFKTQWKQFSFYVLWKTIVAQINTKKQVVFHSFCPGQWNGVGV